jgi:hypothetical protein
VVHDIGALKNNTKKTIYRDLKHCLVSAAVRTVSVLLLIEDIYIYETYYIAIDAISRQNQAALSLRCRDVYPKIHGRHMVTFTYVLYSTYEHALQFIYVALHTADGNLNLCLV